MEIPGICNGIYAYTEMNDLRNLRGGTFGPRFTLYTFELIDGRFGLVVVQRAVDGAMLDARPAVVT